MLPPSSLTEPFSLSLLQIEMLEHKYGGHLVSRRAACTIQTAFRQYQLSKNFEKIRNSLLESRLPRRISLRKVRAPTAESLVAEKALLESCGLLGLPLGRSPSLPPTFAGSLTELEDSFTEQVQSLAKSIDDALSTWSLKTMCSLQESGAYQLHQALHPSAGQPGLETEAAREPDSGPGSGDEAGSLPQGHSGTLMMAFRDVTVQIANQNISVSSSTALSVANCLGAQTAQATAEPAAVQTEQGDAATQEVSEVPASELMDPPVEDSEAAESGAQSAHEPTVAEAVVEEAVATEAEEEEEGAGQAEKGAEAEVGDNSEQLSSSSASTKSAKSGSEVSAAASKEALQAVILSLPRYHCENPASCRSPTLSTDTLRKRLYRIGLNLFNM